MFDLDKNDDLLVAIDRDAIDRFRHAILQVPEDALPELPEGEYYRFQLIGLTVVDREGALARPGRRD